MIETIVFLAMYYLIAYHKPLVKVYNNRKRIWKNLRVTWSQMDDTERIGYALFAFLISLGFLMASMQ